METKKGDKSEAAAEKKLQELHIQRGDSVHSADTLCYKLTFTGGVSGGRAVYELYKHNATKLTMKSLWVINKVSIIVKK